MPLSTEPLIKRLERYPHLRQALGEKWIAEQEHIDPVEGRYPLARWLRMDGFAADLSTIDLVLHDLEKTPGIAERRRRIRSDPMALMETLTELYVAAWFRKEGLAFDLPKKGADFHVCLGGEYALPIEVTTPRLTQWAQELLERLHLVALKTGYAAKVEHRLETLPDTALSATIVDTIVNQALDLLIEIRSNRARPSAHPVQCFPEYKMRITWTVSRLPGVAAITTPGPTSPYALFNRLVALAQRKAAQLSEDRAGVLLVGMQHSPLTEIWSFEDAIRYYSKDDLQFDWARLPNQVKHLILYTLDLKSTNPFSARWIVNPASSLADPAGTQEILQRLFPSPLRPESDSHVDSL